MINVDFEVLLYYGIIEPEGKRLQFLRITPSGRFQILTFNPSQLDPETIRKITNFKNIKPLTSAYPTNVLPSRTIRHLSHEEQNEKKQLFKKFSALLDKFIE